MLDIFFSFLLFLLLFSHVTCRSYKSLDGRTTPSLSGTNPSTPQLSSPDTGHFHLLQDYGQDYVPSPLSPPSPDTPCSRDAHTPSSRDSYTPHMRDAHRLVYSEDTWCSTPDCTFEERVSTSHTHPRPNRFIRNRKYEQMFYCLCFTADIQTEECSTFSHLHFIVNKSNLNSCQLSLM